MKEGAPIGTITEILSNGSYFGCRPELSSIISVLIHIHVGVKEEGSDLETGANIAKSLM